MIQPELIAIVALLLICLVLINWNQEKDKEIKKLEERLNQSLPVIKEKENVFTKEELQTIKIDILHIYGHVDMNELEAHKRNSILNKLKELLGDEYFTRRNIS